jgi:hypothetical protein
MIKLYTYVLFNFLNHVRFGVPRFKQERNLKYFASFLQASFRLYEWDRGQYTCFVGCVVLLLVFVMFAISIVFLLFSNSFTSDKFRM